MINWTFEQWNKFDNAVLNLDFTGIDKQESIANSLNNAGSSPVEDNQVEIAISTLETYIDQGVSTF